MTNEENTVCSALEKQEATCAVQKDGKLFFSKEHGIKPLLDWLEEPDFFRDATVADRVIGRAAALLLIYGGIRELYAQVISEHAARALEEYHIPFSYSEKVPYIINRTNTGMCPMEQRVLQISDPAAAYQILKTAVRSPK